jgi:hypothetical protein
MGNGHFRHLAEQKPLKQSKQKFVELISSAVSPSRSKFIMIGGRGRGSGPYGWSCRLVKLLRCVLFGKCTADPERSSPTYYISVDAVSAKDVPLGGLIDTSHTMGELSPNNPSFWGIRQWNLQLKRLRAYLVTEERYITLDSSKSAFRQLDTKCNRETEGMGSLRSQIYTFLQKESNGDFQLKYPVELLLNCSTDFH